MMEGDMFDDLRDISDDLSLPPPGEESPFESHAAKAQSPRLMGMTRGQRMVLAILLLGTVAVMGAFCLLISGKVIWP